MKPLPGTSLTEHALSQGDALISHWRVKSDYAWDMGVAVGRFMAGMKEGCCWGSTVAGATGPCSLPGPSESCAASPSAVGSS